MDHSPHKVWTRRVFVWQLRVDMSAEVVPGAGSMPRRARHLIPTPLPHRGEVVAAFAVLVLVAHLLLAQLTFVLAVVFAVGSKITRLRVWWLAVPAAAGPGLTL